MKQYSLYEPIFRIHFRLLIGPHEEIIRYGEKYGQDLSKPASAYTIRHDGGAISVWLERFDPGDPVGCAVLFHELCHAVMYVFDNRGVPIGIENSETFCYCAEFLCREFLSRIKKSKGKTLYGA